MAGSFDILGDTVSGLSLLSQTFTGCVRGFEVWQKGKVIADEVTYFRVELEMLGARFKAWGYYWGIERNSHIHHPKFQLFGEVAINCMSLIAYQINSLEALDEEFPVLRVAARPPGPAVAFETLSMLADPQLRRSLEHYRLRESVTSIEDNVTIQERLKWGWQDGKALKKLGILRSLIDGLYQLFPPPESDPASSVVLNSSLASNDIRTLDAIHEHTKDDPLASALAWLKSTIVKMQARTDYLKETEVRKKRRELTNIRRTDSRNARAIGTYQGSDVLIEWKILQTGGPQEKSIVLGERIDHIARVLRADLKPEALRTLPCIGVVETVDLKQKEYGLLYSLPSPSTIFSLQDLIRLRKDLLLGDCFIIAKVLSRAFLYLHLTGWLHKGVRSDNVLFFASDISKVLAAFPYVVGFEYSRVDEPNALTEELADDTEFNLYRHPDSQGIPIEPLSSQDGGSTQEIRTRTPYRREYDIYGLGVILLELGTRRTAQMMLDRALAKQTYGKHSAERFRDWLIDCVAPQLGSSMGQLYRDATLLCLKGNFDLTDKTLEVAFYIDVVKKLDMCHA